MTKTRVLRVASPEARTPASSSTPTASTTALWPRSWSPSPTCGEGGFCLGVDDDGCVRGLPRCDPPADAGSGESGRRTHWRLEERVMQTCRDNIRPAIYPYFEFLRDVLPGRDVAVVRIMHGWSVHRVCHDRHRTYYVRVGSLSREANQEELARLFQQRGHCSPGAPTGVPAHRSRPWTDAVSRTISSASETKPCRPGNRPTIGVGRSRNRAAVRSGTGAEPLSRAGNGNGALPGPPSGRRCSSIPGSCTRTSRIPRLSPD